MYAQDRKQPTCCSQVGHLDAKFFRVYCSGPVSVNSSHLKRVREVGCFHMWLFSQAPLWAAVIPPLPLRTALFGTFSHFSLPYPPLQLLFPLFFTPRRFFWRADGGPPYGRGSDLRGNAGSERRSRRNTVRWAPAGRGATIPRAGLWDPGCEARPQGAESS